MPEPISRVSVVDASARRLREDVLRGRYPAGSYLPPERELAAAYQVTRTTIKHAIVRLVQAGLLETKHGVGTRVREFERLGGPALLPMLIATAGPDWIGEMFEVRRDIGTLVAAKAAANRTGEHRERLDALHAALGAAPDAAAAQSAEYDIHRVLAEATGNRVYGFLVNALIDAYQEDPGLFRGVYADPPAAARRIAPLIGAVRAADPAAAQAAAGAYFTETERLMLGQLRTRQEDR